MLLKVYQIYSGKGRYFTLRQGRRCGPGGGGEKGEVPDACAPLQP